MTDLTMIERSDDDTFNTINLDIFFYLLETEIVIEIDFWCILTI